MSGFQGTAPQDTYANYPYGLSRSSDGTTNSSHHEQSIQSPLSSPWVYIPLPTYEESTEQFAFRALDACLETYLEWAAHRMENERALIHAEIVHLVHHIEASGRFREPREVVWGTQPLDVQLDFKERLETERQFVECKESNRHNVRHFDLYALEERPDEGVPIKGPYEHGDATSELYIVVQRPPAKTILVSIGKWTGRRIR